MGMFSQKYESEFAKNLRFICGRVDDRVDNIEEDMIQVNCHLSSSRFQPCLHKAFKRPAQNIKSRRERNAIFVCLF